MKSSIEEEEYDDESEECKIPNPLKNSKIQNPNSKVVESSSKQEHESESEEETFTHVETSVENLKTLNPNRVRSSISMLILNRLHPNSLSRFAIAASFISAVVAASYIVFLNDDEFKERQQTKKPGFGDFAVMAIEIWM
ncbi:hypothetical protein L6452_10643 [Arctium lappa]|uniref:Uncharacterized protein n=1 Tax=Arctium lappa TaxID=4217 RepID=A0ACB9DNW6_ARCLA|nr:hypothetical protein L6452_10643 [Arctium lappa]